MYKDILQSIDGIEFYAIGAMVLFILFFIGMIIWVIRVEKNYIEKMSKLPLKEDKPEKNGLMNFNNLQGGPNEL